MERHSICNSPQSNLWIQHNLYQNPSRLFWVGIEKLIPKFVREFKGPRTIAKTILKEKSKAGGLALHNFKRAIKPQESRHCHTGTRIGIQIGGTELRIQKLALVFTGS